MTERLCAYRTIERTDPSGETTDWDIIVHFEVSSHRSGTRHSHPGGHWCKSTGSWDPPEDPEMETRFIAAEFDCAHDDLPEPLTDAEITMLRDWIESAPEAAWTAFERMDA